ncbi:zonular occludens toxin domain-containing protein [Methylomonas rhizoryzae]|uniref:zonular occludens toxin domain-containing protein n=1 Tax=Methylomonas rhizoryzae TaxID=2608981 RepID=UPI001232544B|nr:zonular occludens toxin domain-containing protein [Methylomonas rhizoryzae]
MAGITGITGLPGGGKSYTATELFLLPALREGRPIVTNLPLQMDVIAGQFPAATIQFIDFEQFDFKLSNLPAGCLLAIDECWRKWPQGKQAKNIAVDELAVFKEHRHHSDQNGRSMDIVLITQDVADLAKPIRDLIETTIISVKHLDLGREDACIRWYCKRSASITSDGKPPKNAVIRSENVKYKADVWQYYKTHMHAQGGAVNETRIVKSTVFGSFAFKAGAIIAGLAVAVTIWSFIKTGENVKKATTKKEIVTQTETQPNLTQVTQTQAATSPQLTDKRPYSMTWRLAGTLENYGGRGHTLYILVNTAGRIRKLTDTHCRWAGYERECEVDGEIVASYTGSAEPSYTGAQAPQRVASQPVAVASATPLKPQEQPYVFGLED